AAFPVVSAALLIAAGCADSATVTGRVLSVRPMKWAGARSYSLYLWHWPILAIAAQYWGHEMTASQNAGLLPGCVLAAAVSFRLLEQPVRRSATLKRRPGLSLAVGAALILGTIALCQWTIAAHYGASGPFSFGPAGE
ncbi:MAG: hypothetical protein QOG79_7139, partial [Mycobacterium sp.]|nr:hypothetical protein [Mycobacterium sp.]